MFELSGKMFEQSSIYLSRRVIVGSIAATLVACNAAEAQSKPSFEDLLGRLSRNPDLVEKSWAFRDRSVTQGVPTGTPSSRQLNDSSKKLIINCEIASPTVYEQRYRRPIWPKGLSGVTIGVGYDLRFSNAAFLDRDWPQLAQADRDLLAKVVRLSGKEAQKVLRSVSSVVIPWKQAEEQFLAFIPYPTKQTEDAFPNCSSLSDDSFGALVSVVFNRGPQIPRNSDTRLEMYEIKQLMATNDPSQFAKIPGRGQPSGRR